jgi:hypothetical protein
MGTHLKQYLIVLCLLQIWFLSFWPARRRAYATSTKPYQQGNKSIHMNPIEAQLTELHIEQMGGRCGISYDGKTYVERSTSPAGVAIMSNI